MPPDQEKEKLTKQSSIINRAELRRKLIQHAQDTRYWWKVIENPRVSEATLDQGEAVLSAWVRSWVERLPSKGKTI